MSTIVCCRPGKQVQMHAWSARLLKVGGNLCASIGSAAAGCVQLHKSQPVAGRSSRTTCISNISKAAASDSLACLIMHQLQGVCNLLCRRAHPGGGCNCHASDFLRCGSRTGEEGGRGARMRGDGHERQLLALPLCVHAGHHRAPRGYWDPPQGGAQPGGSRRKARFQPLCRTMASLQSYHTTCALVLLVVQGPPASWLSCSITACIDTPCR